MGWNPFRSSWHIAPRNTFGNALSSIGHFYKGVFGLDSGGLLNLRNRASQLQGMDPKQIAADTQRKAQAEAEAAIKQAKFEASVRAGLEKLMLKRRRGFGASMVVQPTLGSTMTLGS